MLSHLPFPLISLMFQALVISGVIKRLIALFDCLIRRTVEVEHAGLEQNNKIGDQAHWQ